MEIGKALAPTAVKPVPLTAAEETVVDPDPRFEIVTLRFDDEPVETLPKLKIAGLADKVAPEGVVVLLERLVTPAQLASVVNIAITAIVRRASTMPTRERDPLAIDPG
jgi:hypothetical protein